MRKSIYLILITLLISGNLISQNTNNLDLNYSENPYWIEMMQDPSANFHQTVEAFNQYWEGREITRGCGYKPFKRWEDHWKNRLNSDGTRQMQDQVLISYLDFKKNHSTRDDNFQGLWTNLGPIIKPGNSGTGQPNGNGRVNAIAFHPTDANTIYVGAPAGGFWISEDGGENWISYTDNMPTLGVSSIAVDHQTPTTIYLGSGDRDANDATGMGVFKSTDGGQSWQQWNNGMGNVTVGRLIMHPTNNQIIFAASSSGVYKTIDGGNNWTNTKSGNIKEIVFKADDPSIVFASGGGNFFRSEDSGDNFTKITSGIGSASRGVIGVSPANAEVVYFHTVSGSAYAATYRSDDAGLTFTQTANSPNIMSYECNGGSGGQGWYDLDLAVDPENADIIYSGGVNIWKSIDGGVNWTINSHWTGSCGVPAVHADCHVLEFSPTDGKFYAGNDGGIYVSDDGGQTWPELTSGLAISQIYKIGQSKTNKDKVMNGYQDNGSATYLGETEGFITVMGGDGMDCAYDHKDDKYAYGEYYNGQGISRIVNNQNQGGISGGIGESGAWVTPIALDVVKNETMFVGAQNIWRSNNIRANSVQWSKISNLGGGNCNVLEQSEANSDIYYVSKDNSSLFRSDNVNSDAPSWTNISDMLPASGSTSDVETNPFDENIVYVTISSKVFKSVNKGLNWEDITLNIPDVNTNTIEYYKSDTEGLFVGTDAGIYYKNSEMSEWILFSEGFPLTANVKEIEVYYDDVNPANNAVRTATYGRGLWSSPGYYGVPTANFISNETNIPMGCGIDFFDKSSGVPHQWNWSFEGATPASSTEQNPTNIKYLTEGTFEVSLTVTNPSGDNTKIISGFITVNGATLPQVDFKAADTVQCTTETAKLIDLSLGCPTAWNWSFEPNTVSFVNGTDQNSQNPEVNFTEAAVYSVSLTVTNAAGNSDLTKQNYISVGGQSIPFTENFDDVTLEANGWTVNNPDGKKTWELKSVAGPMGESNASWINFFNYTSMNARDYLNSPLLSFVGYQNVLMSFDYAYAQRYSQVDSLIVNISNDCGETWTKVYANGPDGNGIFETAEPTSNSFEPTSNAEWAGNGYGAAKPIIDLSSWAGQGNIMLQFESYNKYGNNLYIDNIEISNTVGINELKTENGFVMYPNPANSVLNIYVDSKKEAKTLHILNLQGKIVSEIALKEGNNKINVGNLSKGIYFAQIKGTISNKTSKLIIQ